MRTIRTVHAADKKAGMTTGEIVAALNMTPADANPSVTTSWSGKIRTITVETDDE